MKASLDFYIGTLGMKKIKEQYADAWGTDMAEKIAIFGALRLYLDFVNLFQFLMSFLGQERE